MTQFPRLRPFLQAASTGLLLVLAFPKPDLSFLAWVALVPLLLAVTREARAGRRFLLGYVAGLVFFLGTCYWVYEVMSEYGHLSAPVAALVLAAMVAALALYPGLFAAVVPATVGRGPLATMAGVGALWTAVEFARGYVFVGFPWLYLGYALTDHVLLARLARLTGVYGLSFLVAAFNGGVLVVAREPTRARGMLLAVCFFVLAAITLAGAFVGREPARETAYLLQTAIPLTQVWDDAYKQKLLAEMETATLARQARSGSEPGLVIWPETPAPFYFPEDLELRLRLERLARQTASYMVTGVVTFADAARERPMNSAIVEDPVGRWVGKYDKILLVPFGEYVPWPRLFFFAGKLTAEVGDFVPGQRLAVLPGPKGGRLAVLICYEASFPGLVRRFTSHGARVLVNISDDGWFGDSSARWQHLLMVRMRAIENDRWVLRATNDGVTAVVDPDGRVETFEGGRRAVYAARYGLRATETAYVRLGDWFALFCLAISAFLAVRRVRR